jgi:sporulation protein YlmC with PRC-barrel domain
MLYEGKLKEVMLDILENRVSGIADSINNLNEQGYIPNKNKRTILDWSIILINAYENIDIFSKEQQDNLDIIYNKVIKM